jgi:centrosomal protein CEP120
VPTPVGVDISRAPSPTKFAVVASHPVSPTRTKALPKDWHTHRFSVDLRSIIDTCSRTGAYLTFSYAPLTRPSADSSETHVQATYPPVRTFRNEETFLPHSFWSFEFDMSPSIWCGYLDAIPLVIDLWADPEPTSVSTPQQGISGGSSSFSNKDVGKVASAVISLIQLCRAEEETMVGPVKGKKRRWNPVVRVLDTDNNELAQIKAVFIWEDLGTRSNPPEQPLKTGQLEDQDLYHPIPSTGILQKEKKEKDPVVELRVEAKVVENTKQPVDTFSANGPPGVSEKEEYQAALRLEQWKDEQKRLWLHRLKSMEASLMLEHGRDYHQQETEQRKILLSKTSELEALENRTSTLLQTMRERERQLVRDEHELAEKEEHLPESFRKDQIRVDQEYEKEMNKLRSAQQREQSQCDVLTAQKNTEQGKKQTLEKQLLALQMKMETLQKQSTAAVHDRKRMESSIQQLESERDELKQQLTRVNEARAFYRKAWAKAIADLLEHQNQWKMERAQTRHRKLWKMDHLQQQLVDSMQEPKEEPRECTDPELLRLQQEKETLLSTGIYTPQDKVIALLDEKMTKLQAIQ